MTSKRLELSSVFSLFLLLLSFLLSLRCVSIGLPLSLKTVLSILPSFPPSVSAAVLSVQNVFVSPHLPPCSCPTNIVLPTFFLKGKLQFSYKMNTQCNIHFVQFDNFFRQSASFQWPFIKEHKLFQAVWVKAFWVLLPHLYLLSGLFLSLMLSSNCSITFFFCTAAHVWVRTTCSE